MKISNDKLLGIVILSISLGIVLSKGIYFSLTGNFSNPDIKSFGEMMTVQEVFFFKGANLVGFFTSISFLLLGSLSEKVFPKTDQRLIKIFNNFSIITSILFMAVNFLMQLQVFRFNSEFINSDSLKAKEDIEASYDVVSNLLVVHLGNIVLPFFLLFILGLLLFFIRQNFAWKRFWSLGIYVTLFGIGLHSLLFIFLDTIELDFLVMLNYLINVSVYYFGYPLIGMYLIFKKTSID